MKEVKDYSQARDIKDQAESFALKIEEEINLIVDNKGVIPQ